MMTLQKGGMVQEKKGTLFSMLTFFVSKIRLSQKKKGHHCRSMLKFLFSSQTIINFIKKMVVGLKK